MRLKPPMLLIPALLLLGAAAFTGCDDEQGQPAKAPVEAAEASAEVEADAGPEAEQAQRREAYGIPFPPKVQAYHEFERHIRLYTPLSLEELERFYKGRLVDFEALREPDGVTLRVVGLRAYMPYVRALRRKGARTTEVYYHPSREKPEVAQPVKVAETDEEGRPVDPDRARVPGSPVNLRTPDGELLAPGARWGVPYTPPEGSPLHKSGNKSNFGRPFGEWDPS